MNDYKFLAYHVAKEINKTREEQAFHVANGKAANIEEYRSICGVIRGLNLAENIINDLVQKMEVADD